MSQETAPDDEPNADTVGPLGISYRALGTLKRVLLYTGIAFGLLVVVFPLFWMISSALRPISEGMVRPVPMLPQTWTLENFTAIITETMVPTFYANSILVAIGVVLLTMITATLGGYGLARIDFRYKLFFARGILFGYMFPPILLAIPMFIFWKEFGLINSYPGLILAETAVALPFSLWLMWQFFQTVPYSLEESAQMAGASRFRAFYEIALPMAKPGMIAIAVFAYAGSWNAYTIPKIIMATPERWPLTVGINSLTLAGRAEMGQIMAASALAVIPSFLFVFAAQKYLLRGFRIGNVK